MRQNILFQNQIIISNFFEFVEKERLILFKKICRLNVNQDNKKLIQDYRNVS